MQGRQDRGACELTLGTRQLRWVPSSPQCNRAVLYTTTHTLTDGNHKSHSLNGREHVSCTQKGAIETLSTVLQHCTAMALLLITTFIHIYKQATFVKALIVLAEFFSSLFFHHWLKKGYCLFACVHLSVGSLWLRDCKEKKKEKSNLLYVELINMHGSTHKQSRAHILMCLPPRETVKKRGIAFYCRCRAFCVTQPIVCFCVCKWWKRIKVDNTAASAAAQRHRWAQGEEK